MKLVCVLIAVLFSSSCVCVDLYTMTMSTRDCVEERFHAYCKDRQSTDKEKSKCMAELSDKCVEEEVSRYYS
jgi:hypothetical protein